MTIANAKLPLGSSPTSPASGDGTNIKSMRHAAEEFESLFLNLVLETMRKSVEKSGLIDGGNAEEIYRSLLDQEYARTMASQDFTGIAKQIERQLSSHASVREAMGKKEALNAYDQQLKMSVGLGATSLPRSE